MQYLLLNATLRKTEKVIKKLCQEEITVKNVAEILDPDPDPGVKKAEI